MDEGAAADLDAELARTPFAPFKLTLEGVGVFGASRRPRALWVGVTPSAELDILQGRVEAAAQRAGLPAETRKFTPHVTLARLNGGDDRLGRFLASNGLFRAGPFDVTGFSLMRSRLGGGDPLYDEVGRYGDDAVDGGEDGEDWTDGLENG